MATRGDITTRVAARMTQQAQSTLQPGIYNITQTTVPEAGWALYVSSNGALLQSMWKRDAEDEATSYGDPFADPDRNFEVTEEAAKTNNQVDVKSPEEMQQYISQAGIQFDFVSAFKEYDETLRQEYDGE